MYGHRPRSDQRGHRRRQRWRVGEPPQVAARSGEREEENLPSVVHVAPGHAATAGRGDGSLPGVYRAGAVGGISGGDSRHRHTAAGRVGRPA